MAETISAVIITHNEERNIQRCLASLREVVDEIIVVDAFSTDRTKAICADFGVRFEQHAWEGYSTAKNRGNALAASAYILSVDADEVLSPELQRAVITLKETGLSGAYAVSRLNNYCGVWIRHGEWYPDRKVRLFRKGDAYWEGTVHEQLKFATPTATKHLDGKLLHYTYDTLDQHVRKSVAYSKLIAERDLRAGKRRLLVVHGLLKPTFYFLKSYLIKLGFLDGRAGFTIAVMIAWERYLRFAFYIDLKKNR